MKKSFKIIILIIGILAFISLGIYLYLSNKKGNDNDDGNNVKELSTKCEMSLETNEENIKSMVTIQLLYYKGDVISGLRTGARKIYISLDTYNSAKELSKSENIEYTFDDTNLSIEAIDKTGVDINSDAFGNVSVYADYIQVLKGIGYTCN